MQKPQRTLKLQPEYRPAKTHTGLKIVPSLKLSGVWLELSGFKVGQSVTVSATDGELTIKAQKP